jgi:hypothetical protein
MVNPDRRLRSGGDSVASVNGASSRKQQARRREGRGGDEENGYSNAAESSAEALDHRENESSSSSCSRGSGAFDRNGDDYDDFEESFHDDDDDHDGNDRIPLVVRSSTHSAEGERQGDGQRTLGVRTANKPRRKPLFTSIVICIAMAVTGLLVLYAWSSPSVATEPGGSSVRKQTRNGTSNATVASQNPNHQQEQSLTPQQEQDDYQPEREGLPVRYGCPDAPPSPFGAKMDELHHSSWYGKGSSSQQANGGIRNVSEYLKVFREAEFDNWGHSYDQVKHGMQRWKSEQFVDLLLEGDGNRDDKDDSSGSKGEEVKTVYESACGIGLNLFMTLEILKESAKRSVEHVVAYGNEYQRESTLVARSIASSDQFPGRPGIVCQSDSTNLSYVPSDAFDLVYTGYISPLADPLRLAEVYGYYTEYCESKNESVHARAMRAQHYQEEWYAAWASEMIRIAKPGAKIIVEQVSYPLCQALYDWGGVSQNFWKRATAKYGWRVDPEAFVYQDDTIFRHRYHLMMRKLAAEPES